MLDKISKIKVNGSYFDTLTEFELFKHQGKEGKEKSIKSALIYGRNGAGKSTIAKAFRKIKGDDVPDITFASCFDRNDCQLQLTNDDKAAIYVFDEEYIDKNIKFKEDNIDTIVMLGPAADLSEKIEAAIVERDKVKKAYDDQVEKCKEFEGYSNIKAPGYWLLKIGNSLRGDENWSGRDKVIREGRTNTQVRDETYKQFVDIAPSKTRDELIVDFEEGKKQLLEIRNTGSKIDASVPQIVSKYEDFDVANISRLLSLKMEIPELSDREKRLFEIVEKSNAGELEKRLDVFYSEDTKECPYCFQKIDTVYKKSLVASIEKVLNRAVDDHREELKRRKLEQVNIDLSLFENLSSFSKCKNLIKNLNEDICHINEHIQTKADNPYNPIIVQITDIKQSCEDINKALIDLERERLEYNDIDKRKTNLKKRLSNINAQIAHYDIKDLVQQYDQQLVEAREENEKQKTLKNTLNEKQDALTSLEAERNNIQIALDSINDCMKYIFFEENRLSLEYDGEAYKLLSRGKSVKPCDVSVGERNIIALSYFFTQVLNGQEQEKAYDKEYLLIIDDPISSYDLENKVGILSFVKLKVGLFLEGNQNTKILMLTHDIATFYDLHKIFEEIMEACKKKSWIPAPAFNSFELRNKSLTQFSYKKRHEYSELIKCIYMFANGDETIDSLVIGNIMRQALEAFSTFEYKKSIEDVSTNEDILKLLNDPKYISYFKNLMYRLVLHGGSHREEQIKTMNDYNFFSVISKEEKQRTAKDVICFMYLLNKRHIIEHLNGVKGVESVLKMWCKEILERAVLI